MKNFIFSLLFLLSMDCYAQAPKIINWNDCDMNNTFVQVEHEAQWKGDMASLIAYMNKNVNDPQLKNVQSGRVIVGIIIDENGKTCGRSFINTTGVELNSEAFKEAVNKMPDWIPATQNGKAVRFQKMQVLNIREGKFCI